ncbi:type II/IV secretion system protein [bacterium]|nr:type II/IV secretion system protein [bacterium]
MVESTSGTPAPEGRQRALQEELRELVDLVGPAPLVDLLLERAFQLRATDIHLDPTRTGLRVRLRVDGMLHDVLQLPPELMNQVVSRVKLMSGMDITERRFAQDGHISSAVLKHQRDVRVGSGPTIFGERLVLRLMPDTTTFNQLEELGLDDEQIRLLNAAMKLPYGMILSVGPVGSGKSSTMYSCLERLNEPGRSLVTIEDPVERRIDGIAQIQTDPKINFGFVEALRGILRQDPDVVMVGEIRDPETAHIAIRAGLTGVRVLSTLHANDSTATVDVFRDFGIPPMFIADSVNCIISQRLVRKVCESSFEEYQPDFPDLAILGIDPSQAHEVRLRRGIPADINFHTGYLGRTGVFEVLSIDTTVRSAILGNASAKELRAMAIQNGMQTLEQSAIKKVRAGITTLSEMHRVLIVD